VNFEGLITQSCEEAHLWPEAEVILKVVQLEELLAIRHCVFIIGSAGAGKSTAWKMLAKAQDKAGRKTRVVDLNPKSITTN
jgi:dynein heavy chain